MRTVTFKSVLDRVAGLLQGVASATGGGVRGLDRTDAAVAQRMITNAAREFWERYEWPELMNVERRQFRATYAAGSTYAAGTEVWFWGTRSYYQALRAVIAGQAPATLSGTTWTVNLAYWTAVTESQTADVIDAANEEGDWNATTTYARGARTVSYVDGNTYQLHGAATSLNEEPSANLTKWGVVNDFVRSIALEQTGETAIGAVRMTYDSDPRLTGPGRTCTELEHDMREDAVIVWGDASQVWVEFWRVVPEWVGDEWDAETAYLEGDTVYWTDGEMYLAVGDDPAQGTDLPGTSPLWVKQEFPRVLAEMVAWRVFGEMDPLHGEGPMGDGLALGEQIFGQEILKLERKQRQARQLRVLTR